MKGLITAAVLALTPVAAMADGVVEQIVFECVTDEGREIKVTDTGFGISYSYGIIGQVVELRLDSDFNPTKVREWGGEPPMIIYEEVVFGNVDHTYTVYKEFDLETHLWAGGVVVQQNGETLTVVTCSRNYINTAAFAFEDLLTKYTFFW